MTAFKLRRERIDVTAHGADFIRRVGLQRDEARRALGLPIDGHMFLAIGFIQPHKGFDRAIRAFARSADKKTGRVRKEVEALTDFSLRDVRLTQPNGAPADAWLLLEFELWLHAVRDPEMGVVGAERFRVMREGLAGGLRDWSEEFGFELPAPADELAAQLIALLVGLAFQFRLDPAVVPERAVVDGLRRLLDLPATVGSSATPTRTAARGGR